jgi:hypothetical protein
MADVTLLIAVPERFLSKDTSDQFRQKMRDMIKVDFR